MRRVTVRFYRVIAHLTKATKIHYLNAPQTTQTTDTVNYTIKMAVYGVCQVIHCFHELYFVHVTTISAAIYTRTDYRTMVPHHQYHTN